MADDFNVGPVANAIRELAAEKGEIRYKDVDWSLGPSPASENIRKAILRTCQDNLYIDPDEEKEVLKIARREKPITEALLQELKLDSPLFVRVQAVQAELARKTCSSRFSIFQDCLSKGEKEGLLKELRERLRPALQLAAMDPNEMVAQAAKDLLQGLK